MLVLAIDPGTTESAFVIYDASACYNGGGIVLDHGKRPNDEVVTRLAARLFTGCISRPDHLAIEMIQSYGMAAGRELFETAYWVGRFVQAWGGPATRIYRTTVKGHVCKSGAAKDANVRQALLDRFGAPGTKKQPGATYGLHGDEWAALAVAVTFADQHQDAVASAG